MFQVKSRKTNEKGLTEERSSNDSAIYRSGSGERAYRKALERAINTGDARINDTCSSSVLDDFDAIMNRKKTDSHVMAVPFATVSGALGSMCSGDSLSKQLVTERKVVL